MSYSMALEEFILKLKGGVFFLSPREKLFLNFLEELGIPESIVKEGIERCYTALNPRRRSKHPVFLCYRSIMDVYENFLRIEAQKVRIDWEHRFEEKVKKVKELVNFEIKKPESEEDAQKVLKEIESRIMKELWKQLSKEERDSIGRKYREFRDNKEVFAELVKRELQKKFKIPPLSLYVD